jgi:hypothetical protein
MLYRLLLLFTLSTLLSPLYSKQLELVGYSGYQRYGNVMNLRVDAVRNNRPSGISGDLKLTLWATNTPYRGGYIQGHIIAEARLGQLYGNRHFPRVSKNANFYAPARGRYYMTLTLAEYKHNGRYEVMDYITYPNMDSW